MVGGLCLFAGSAAEFWCLVLGACLLVLAAMVLDICAPCLMFGAWSLVVGASCVGADWRLLDCGGLVVGDVIGGSGR